MQNSFVIEPPSGEAKHCVICLHGLGAGGHSFKDLVPQFNLPENHDIRFIFPHAPMRSITINNGEKMRGWYDIFKRIDSINHDADIIGIEQSISRVNDVVVSQMKQGIGSHDIILIGFSQGGVIAGLSTLLLEHTFSGAILLSTYLPAWKYFRKQITQHNIKTEFVVAHGADDNVVPIQAGELLRANLESVGIKVQWHCYPLFHNLCTAEINMMSRFIQSNINCEI